MVRYERSENILNFETKNMKKCCIDISNLCKILLVLLPDLDEYFFLKADKKDIRKTRRNKVC